MEVKMWLLRIIPFFVTAVILVLPTTSDAAVLNLDVSKSGVDWTWNNDRDFIDKALDALYGNECYGDNILQLCERYSSLKRGAFVVLAITLVILPILCCCCYHCCRGRRRSHQMQLHINPANFSYPNSAPTAQVPQYFSSSANNGV